MTVEERIARLAEGLVLAVRSFEGIGHVPACPREVDEINCEADHGECREDHRDCSCGWAMLERATDELAAALRLDAMPVAELVSKERR